MISRARAGAWVQEVRAGVDHPGRLARTIRRC